MSFTYLVTLTPQAAYFFGAEQTFGSGETQSYSAKSTHFPQQSSILGVLRKTLLIQNGNLTMHLKGEWVDSRGGKKGNDSNYFEAIRVAGKGSFSYEKECDLGIIKKISPLFITHKDTHYTMNAKDAAYETQLQTNQMSLNGKSGHNLVFHGYDAKNHSTLHFINNKKEKLSFDDIFEEVQTVGIKKSVDGETKEDGFFQKSSFVLKGNTSFSFYLTLKEEIAWSNAYVTLGADQSSFEMKLKKSEESFESTFNKAFQAKKLDRIVLHSETLLNQSAYDNTLFILGERKSYRQLSDAKKGKKSKRYFLLEAGSVLYTQNLEKLEAALRQPHLQKIGINNFTSLKGQN